MRPGLRTAPLYSRDILQRVARMRRHIVFAALLLGFGLLAGCGQKGPLYLPPPKSVVATPAPAVSDAKPASAVTAAAPTASTSSGG